MRKSSKGLATAKDLVSEQPKIKRCPFCGSVAKVVFFQFSDEIAYVQCSDGNCPLLDFGSVRKGPLGQPSFTLPQWNTRAKTEADEILELIGAEDGPDDYFSKMLEKHKANCELMSKIETLIRKK